MRSLVRTRRIRALEEKYLPKEEEPEVIYELVFLEEGEEPEEEEDGVEVIWLFEEES